MINSISIVIPTYKRYASLTRLLKSISKQTLLPDEILICSVKGSENDIEIAIKNITLPISLIFSEPSVCKQRNLGINASKSKYILLCDDDIELPKNYTETLYSFLEANKKINIATGEEYLLTKQGKWGKFEFNLSASRLIFNHVFGLSIWSDLKNKIYPSNIIFRYLINFYSKKSNHISKAGWPIVTNFSYPIIETSIYGLGCAMIKSEKLKENLFDESISQYGFGDNYDVAFRINTFHKKIHVLRSLHFKHYKSQQNRLHPKISYYLRTKTLYIFLEKLPFFTFKNRLFFLWSLIGNGLLFFFTCRLRFFYVNFKVFLYAFYRLLLTKKIYS
jgi:glycosyltransferase involved in cell wall biosynthesis